MGKRAHSLNTGGNANWYNHYEKHSMIVPQKNKIEIELPYDPAILLLVIYLKILKTCIHKDTCTPRFIEALLTVAKRQRQLKCFSVEG